MKKFIKILEDVLFIAVLVFLCGMFYSIHVNKTVAFMDYHFFRIISNSMAPTLKPNACIIVKEVSQEELKKGDIITFVSQESSIYGNYNTHRIYDIVKNERTGETEYVTKGDYFSIPDEKHVRYENIMGRYIRKVPLSKYISFLVIRLSNNRVYFSVVIFPLVLCLLSYIYELLHILIFGLETEEEMKARREAEKERRMAIREEKKRKKESNAAREKDATKESSKE